MCLVRVSRPGPEVSRAMARIQTRRAVYREGRRPNHTYPWHEKDIIRAFLARSHIDFVLFGKVHGKRLPWFLCLLVGNSFDTARPRTYSVQAE